MKLLIESVERSNFNVLTEAVEENDKKRHFIEGIFLQGDIENGNRRIYPTQILKEKLVPYSESIRLNRAVGELDHPDTPSTALARAAIKIESIAQDGDNFRGRAKVLTTPRGAIVSALIEDGVELGVSSRMLGSVKTNRKGISVVQEDLRIIAVADVVSDPSAPDAYVTSLMESREWIIENGVLKESELETIQKKIDRSVVEGRLLEFSQKLFNLSV